MTTTLRATKQDDVAALKARIVDLEDHIAELEDAFGLKALRPDVQLCMP